MARLSSFLQGLILITGLCMFSDATLLGSTECTYGPSYWCDSLRNAKQCSAVHHCIESVWETQKLPADNDGICDLCKDMVEQAKDTLESNQTEEAVMNILENACQAIPLRELSKECSELADEYVPQVLMMLASQMNPQIVCATAGLCNSVRVDRLMREHGLTDWQHENKVVAPVKSSEPDPGDCDDCNKFLNDVITLVHEHSEQELMDHLLSICGELGGVSDGCAALVTVNLDDIYNFLLNDLDPGSVCSLFGMCGDVSKAVTSVTVTGDEPCDLCIMIAQHWRDVITENATMEEFKQVLEAQCDNTGSFRGECRALVDSYYQAAYSWLITEFDPKQVCEMVGACGVNGNKAVWTTLHTGSMKADEPLVPETNEIVNLAWTGGDEANSYHHSEQSLLPRAKLQPSIHITVAGQSGVIAASDQTCTMCEFTLHFIQVQLEDKATKQEIEDAVKNVCRYLPQDLNEQCDDYVDAYGDQIISLLEQEIDPSTLCPLLGLCPSKTNNVMRVTDDVTCVACEYIMVKVKDLLDNKTNQDDVKAALERVCSMMPHALRDECQTFVDQNAIEVMELIGAGIQPEKVCRMMNFCSKSAMGRLPPLDSSNQLPVSRLFSGVSAAPRSWQVTGQNKACVMCEFVMNVLEKMVLDNNTHIESDIRSGVKQVCVLLPPTLQEDCLGFVEQYSDAIVEMIVHSLEPAQVCRELTLCKQAKLPGLVASLPTRRTKRVMKRSTRRMTKRSAGDLTNCIMCKALYNVQTTGQDMLQFCSDIVDAEIQTMCQSVAASLVPSAIQDDSAATCSGVQWCPAATHLIGSSQCTWGPAFWCNSVIHATSCGAGALSHCQDRVWMGVAPPAE